MREDLLDNIKSTNIIDFALSLRDRIRTSIEIANEMEDNAKKKSKCWYDSKARDVSYDVGEQMLLLLPLIRKPYQAKYCGPITVEKRLEEVNYLISTPDRIKSKRTVHVKLLRKYIARPSVTPVLPVALVFSFASVQHNHEDQFRHVNLDHLQMKPRGQLTTLLYGCSVTELVVQLWLSIELC